LRAYDYLVFVTPDIKTLLPVLVSFGSDPDPANRSKAAQYMASMVPLYTPDEIEKAGVYKAFPELRPATSGTPPTR
jgi:hypothetical protein